MLGDFRSMSVGELELDAIASETGFSGVVRVDRGDRVEVAKAYGLAHRGYDVPNEADTRFALASGTKGLTALTLVSLVEDGTLQLTTTARSVLGKDPPTSGQRSNRRAPLAHQQYGGAAQGFAAFTYCSWNGPAANATGFFALEEERHLTPTLPADRGRAAPGGPSGRPASPTSSPSRMTIGRARSVATAMPLVLWPSNGLMLFLPCSSSSRMTPSFSRSTIVRSPSEPTSMRALLRPHRPRLGRPLRRSRGRTAPASCGPR